MASYLGLVLKTAFSRWGIRTDLASGVLGAIVPCGFVLTGRPVPENVSLLVAETAVGVVAGWVVIRLLCAPYLMWKADQATILDLKHQIDDPERQRRERNLAAQETARFEFAREVARYTDGIRASSMLHCFNQEVLDSLESHGCLFNYDNNFDDAWRNFTEALICSKSVTQIALDKPDLDGFIEVQVNRNLNYYMRSYRLFGRAIISFLTYKENNWPEVSKEAARLYAEHEDRGRVPFHDEASLDAILSRRSPRGTGSGTQQ